MKARIVANENHEPRIRVEFESDAERALFNVGPLVAFTFHPDNVRLREEEVHIKCPDCGVDALSESFGHYRCPGCYAMWGTYPRTDSSPAFTYHHSGREVRQLMAYDEQQFTTKMMREGKK